MKCPEYQRWLQKRLDGEAPIDDPVLSQHLGECPACQELQKACRSLELGLRGWPQPVAPNGLTERIVSRVLMQQRTMRRRHRLRVATALAAGILLLIVGGYSLYLTDVFDQDRGNEQAAQNRIDNARMVRDSGKKTDRTEKLQTPSLGEALGDARNLAMAVTRRTADETLAQARRWLPAGTPFSLAANPMPKVDSLTPMIDPPAQSLKHATQTMAVGLQPVTTSWKRAVNLFLHDLPPMSASQPSGS